MALASESRSWTSTTNLKLTGSGGRRRRPPLTRVPAGAGGTVQVHRESLASGLSAADSRPRPRRQGRRPGKPGGSSFQQYSSSVSGSARESLLVALPSRRGMTRMSQPFKFFPFLVTGPRDAMHSSVLLLVAFVGVASAFAPQFSPIVGSHLHASKFPGNLTR